MVDRLIFLGHKVSDDPQLNRAKALIMMRHLIDSYPDLTFVAPQGGRGYNNGQENTPVGTYSQTTGVSLLARYVFVGDNRIGYAPGTKPGHG